MRKTLLMDIITANEYFELMRLLQNVIPKPPYYATIDEIKEVIEEFRKRRNSEEHYKIDFLLAGLKNFKEGKIITPGSCLGDKLTLNEFKKFKSKYEVILHNPDIAKLPISSALYGLKDCIVDCEKLH